MSNDYGLSDIVTTVDENDKGDKKFKVYSKEACLQRKIEITKVYAIFVLMSIRI
jgi:hypothetical protein